MKVIERTKADTQHFLRIHLKKNNKKHEFPKHTKAH